MCEEAGFLCPGFVSHRSGPWAQSEIGRPQTRSITVCVAACRQRRRVDLGPPLCRRPNSDSIRYPNASETCVNPGFVLSSCGNRLSWLSAFQLTRSEEHTSELQSPCNLV